jgi:hypothetical protein
MLHLNAQVSISSKGITDRAFHFLIMSHTAKLTVVKAGADPRILVCEKCGQGTSHAVLCGIHSRDSSPEGDIHVGDEYLVVQCRGCGTVSFCRESWSSEDYDPETGGMAISRDLFPPRITGRQPLRDIWYVPAQIRQVYDETRAAIISNLPILAGIGIRAIIETVCKEKNASGKNLKETINSLATLQLIAKKEAEILHSLRFMGNAAAHETKAHSSEELNVGFDIVEHLLNTVYLLERQQQRLQRKSGPVDPEQDCF